MPDYAKLRDAGDHDVRRAAGKIFAGQADDPFFLDLRVFDLLYGGDLSEAGHDTLAGYNVNTIALQVPKSDAGRTGDDPSSVSGHHRAAEHPDARQTGAQPYSGTWVQVSRLGNPLVNEVVIPRTQGRVQRARSRRTTPQFLPTYVIDPEVPKLIEAIYGIPAPATRATTCVRSS